MGKVFFILLMIHLQKFIVKENTLFIICFDCRSMAMYIKLSILRTVQFHAIEVHIKYKF